MAKCFQESHEAYARGARAKELSNQGKDHQRKMEDLNKEASDFIFVGSCLFVRTLHLTISFFFSFLQKITR